VRQFADTGLLSRAEGSIPPSYQASFCIDFQNIAGGECHWLGKREMNLNVGGDIIAQKNIICVYDRDEVSAQFWQNVKKCTQLSEIGIEANNSDPWVATLSITSRLLSVEPLSMTINSIDG
jgi:hypothetical protein